LLKEIFLVVFSVCLLLHAGFLLVYSSFLKFKAIYFSETSIGFHRNFRCCMPHYINLKISCSFHTLKPEINLRLKAAIT
jgi:hypothetical protein